MKIIITSSGNSVEAIFDRRFGRAAWFCIYEEGTEKLEFIENEHVNANNGAGTKAAEKMIELGAGKIISGDFGPKAKELLDKFNIQLIMMDENDARIVDIIEKLK